MAFHIFRFVVAINNEFELNTEKVQIGLLNKTLCTCTTINSLSFKTCLLQCLGQETLVYYVWRLREEDQKSQRLNRFANNNKCEDNRTNVKALNSYMMMICKIPLTYSFLNQPL